MKDITLQYAQSAPQRNLQLHPPRLRHALTRRTTLIAVLLVATTAVVFAIIYRPLPRLPDFDTFRTDQSRARTLCRRLDIPELPDITGLDEGGQRHFYDMFNRLRARPDDPDEYGWLGRVYEAQKFPEFADQLYRIAISKAPADHEWHYHLALLLENQGRVDEAEAEYRLAAERRPDFAPVHMRLAWRAAERGAPTEALQEIARYIELRPDDPFGYIEQAQLHFEQEHWDDLAVSLQTAASKGSLNRKAHRLLGALRRHQGNEKESRFHLLMSAKPLPGDDMADPLALLVRRLETYQNPVITRFTSLVDSARYADALAMRDQVIDAARAGNSLGSILGRLAECYRQTRQLKEAYDHALRARAELPDDPEPRALAALILMSAGRFPEAIADADAALTMNADHLIATYARGMSLMQLALQEHQRPPDQRAAEPPALLDAATRDLQRCVDADPVKLDYLVGLGTARALAGDFDTAQDLLTTASMVAPGDQKVLAYLARARDRQSFWPQPAANP